MVKHKQYKHKLNSIIVNKKRAEVSSRVMLELGGLILAVIIFFVFLDFGSQLMGTFTKDPKAELAKGNFNALNNWVREVINSKENFYAIQGKPITIPDGFSIAGFDAGSKLYDLNKPQPGILGILKPKVCKDKACLALIKMDSTELRSLLQVHPTSSGDLTKIISENQAKLDNVIISYTIFDSVNQFSQPYGDINKNSGSKFLGNSYITKDLKDQFLKDVITEKNLINEYNIILSPGTDQKIYNLERMFISNILQMYGASKDPDSKNNIGWGIQNLYIEKFTRFNDKNEPEIQVYLGRDTDYTYQRYNSLQAIAQFDKFIKSYDNAQSYRGKQTYSAKTAKVIENPCFIGDSINLNLPAGITLSILDGEKIFLYSLDSNNQKTEIKNKDLTSSLSFATNTNEISYFYDYKKFSAQVYDFEIKGNNNLFFYKVDNKIKLSDKKLPITEKCLDTFAKDEKTTNQKAIGIFDEFNSAYKFYSNSNFEDKNNQGCLIAIHSFENDLLNDKSFPPEYTIYINKDTNRITLVDKDNKITKQSTFLVNTPLCYLDSFGVKNNIDYFSTSLEENNNPNEHTLIPTFFISNDKSLCLVKSSAGTPVMISGTMCSYKASKQSD